ncbi:MAG: hypothetical protein COV35_02195 [Alphaproteobacteria bacterium CG11_big_fil_rev_8_21_14_0_20_39_49]|nr:MAG: hypothetical protein COV35_02195 [Alphaproteobacteria bacterium CG11_big_fil_rev_8_21_14_0_20_39_49]
MYMKNTALKTFLTISVAFYTGDVAIAQQSSLKSDVSQEQMSEGQKPEQINGLIKKMMLVASDVLKIKNEDYNNDDFSKVYQLAQYEEKGLVDKYWENRVEKKGTLDNSVNPLYSEKVRENYEKERQEAEEKLKQKKEQIVEQDISVKYDEDTEVIVSEEGMEILLKRRPEENYRNTVLPDLVSKKNYNRDNMHLPVAIYEEEFQQILLKSIMTQDIDVMRAIIERLGSTEYRDKEGNTPLLYAVISGNMVPIKVLVGMGSSVNVRNNQGVSPLYIAVKDRNLELTEYLVKSGANPEVITNNGKTLLMVAAENNDARMLNMLLDIGLDVNKKMNDGNTALHFAAMRNSSLVSDILITKGAIFDIRNRNGYTSLMIGAAYGSTETVNLLLNSGADITTTDAKGQDAYLLAKNNNHYNIVSMIDAEKTNFLYYQQPQIGISPIDESITTAPLPIAKPEETPAPVEMINESESPAEYPAYEENSNAPYEMPMPVFSKEEMDQM